MQSHDQTNEPAPVFFKKGKTGNCAKCGKDLPGGELIRTDGPERILCLTCAGLGKLVFLPAGDPALTRRARQFARQWAPVVEWSRRRKRYERQGILVDEAALRQAKTANDADAPEREARREIEQRRREREDAAYRAEFADALRRLFPGCPPGVADDIANHACEKYSGRVGRCAAAKELSEQAITLAVVAHIRHLETGYDRLLARGVDRDEARDRIRNHLQEVLESWRQPLTAAPPQAKPAKWVARARCDQPKNRLVDEDKPFFTE